MWVVIFAALAFVSGKNVSVPLRGVGCNLANVFAKIFINMFPSPCGVWVVKELLEARIAFLMFPSPCGVWVVSLPLPGVPNPVEVSVTLRGVGCNLARRYRWRL